MAPASPPPPISPGKLRLDLYGHESPLPEDDAASASSSSSSPPPLVTSVLASLLDRAIAKDRNMAISSSSKNSNRASSPPPAASLSSCRAFDGDRVVDLSLRSFLERISRYTRVGPAVYVVAYAYLDRLRLMNPGLRFHRGNAHRLVLVAVMVASKFVEDLNHRNSYFAKVGGVSTPEMNRLEVEFLFRIRFKLHVNVSVFESYCSHLEREVSAGGGYHIERTLQSCAEAVFAVAAHGHPYGDREHDMTSGTKPPDRGDSSRDDDDDNRRRLEARDRPVDVLYSSGNQQRRAPLVGATAAAAAGPY